MNDSDDSDKPGTSRGEVDRLGVAVITVTYSPGEHLEKLITSLGEATRRPAILLMADNGSTDGAPETALKKHSDRVRLVRTGGNIGYGAAVNCANRQCDKSNWDPEFFVVVNPDVVFQPGSIDALIDAARRHPHAAAVGPKIRNTDGSVYPSARAIPSLGTGIGHALLGSVWPSNPWTTQYREAGDTGTEHETGWLSGSCLLIRREAFAEVGGFDERFFMYFEDVDLGDRFARAGWSNVFTPTAEVVHDQGHSAESPTNRGFTLSAHHNSAYQFLADRLPKKRHAPLRLVLRLGLGARKTLIRLLGRVSDLQRKQRYVSGR